MKLQTRHLETFCTMAQGITRQQPRLAREHMEELLQTLEANAAELTATTTAALATAAAANQCAEETQQRNEILVERNEGLGRLNAELAQLEERRAARSSSSRGSLEQSSGQISPPYSETSPTPSMPENQPCLNSHIYTLVQAGTLEPPRAREMQGTASTGFFSRKRPRQGNERAHGHTGRTSCFRGTGANKCQ